MKQIRTDLGRAVVALTLLIGSATGRAQSPSTSVMTGEVKGETGKPIAGATVLVLAAGPRKGNTPLCPYSYPDCGKRAVSDEHGHFAIASLDPELDFCVIAMAKGCSPYINSKLIPENGPLTCTLKTLDLASVPANRHVWGRIIGPSGEPVIGAMLSFDGEEHGTATNFGGSHADHMTITDLDGEFHSVSPNGLDALIAVINAPYLASRRARLESGKPLLVRMTAGCTLTGRLSFHGHPLGNLRLMAATSDHDSTTFLHGFEAVTDATGAFKFENLPPDIACDVFGPMETFNAVGAGFLHKFQSAKDGGSLDLGELEARPAHRIAGRVICSDGKPIPPDTKILIDRPDAWDTQVVPLDRDGAFTVTGIPEEAIEIDISFDGYLPSPKNRSLEPFGRRSLIGQVTGNNDRLKVLMEPSSTLDTRLGQSSVDTEEIKKMPLAGVE